MKQVISKTSESRTIAVDNCNNQYEYGIITKGEARVGIVVNVSSAATPVFTAVSLGKRDSYSNFIDRNYLYGLGNLSSIQELLNKALGMGHEVYSFDSTLELLEWAARKQQTINNIIN